MEKNRLEQINVPAYEIIFNSKTMLNNKIIPILDKKILSRRRRKIDLASVLRFELVGELSQLTSKAEFGNISYFEMVSNRAQYVPGLKSIFLRSRNQRSLII
ncbi:hypothetical protein ABM34_10310 [Companilactobacillus ginsenosidimutans]|uniref:Uncharacterized protein n=1 Tax=Companilactobacillus ginsenosidimutans TaxID=1007676 RepID=A0A0H4QIW6_9LACO|nr:hypothetical protein ABM34_10310 [Companilactobacillus ginsenosidimutans]